MPGCAPICMGKDMGMGFLRVWLVFVFLFANFYILWVFLSYVRGFCVFFTFC